MSKSITKIVKATLGLTMAIGVGFAIRTNNNKTTPIYATSDFSDTFTSASFASTGSYTAFSNVNGTSSDAVYLGVTARNGNATKYNIQLNSGDTSSKNRGIGSSTSGGYIRKVSVVWATQTDNTNNRYLTIRGSNTAYTATTLSSGTEIGKLTYTTNATTATMSEYTTKNFQYVSIVASGAIYMDSITIEWEDNSAAPTISSVSVSGNMSINSYNTVQSWSNAGLSASGTMSDESSYTGQFEWSYSPTTPAAAVLANSGNEIDSTSVTATATAGDKSASKATSGISVSYATVAQLTEATPATGTLTGVIAKGIVSQVDEVETSQYFNATYFISDDGTTTGQYKVFHGKGVGNADFQNVNDIKVGDVVVVYGDVTTYKGTKEFGQGNYLLSLDRPASSDPSITINEPNFTIKVSDADVQLSADAQNVPVDGGVLWDSESKSVATITDEGLVHAVAPGSSEITAMIVDSELNILVSNSITVSVVEDALVDGDTFVIKATYNTSTYYLTGVGNSLGTVSTDSSDAMVFTAVEGAVAGQFQFKNGNNYLKSVNNNNLNLTSNDEDASTLWTALNNGSGTTIESVSYSGRKLQYNHNGDTGDNTKNRFACYTSAQTAISIEMIVAPEVDSVTVFGDSTADAGNAVSVTKDFLYEITYVDPLNPGSGAVNVTILNSNDEEEGASVTSDPDGSSFSVTFTASDTYTITVISVEDPSKSGSTTIEVSNIYVPAAPILGNYEKLGGDELVEGDYIISYDNAALNTTISSDRAQYEAITPENDAVSTADATIVWHIAPVDETYFTIYNAESDSYLASTGTKNQAQLLDGGEDDKSLWSVDVEDGQVEFVNKYNASKSINSNLRKNGTYGFACYGTGTGGKLTLYRADIKTYLKSATAIATITEDANGLLLRLGSYISVEKWKSITAIGEITDYGVMIYKTDSEAKIHSETPVEDAYRNSGVNPAISRKGNGNPPTASDGCYAFAAKIRVTNIDTVFCAASFVVINGQYYFFNEQHVTARGLGA